MIFGEILRLISTVFGLLLSLCYLYQIVYLWLPIFKKETPKTANTLHRFAILIAARNEEQVLPYLLQSIQLQDYPAEYIKVFVVADNCTDRTAVVAEEGGAVVFQRNSKTEIGKGYALHYLLERIDETENLENFDAFLVFDADNLKTIFFYGSKRCRTNNRSKPGGISATCHNGNFFNVCHVYRFLSKYSM